MVVDFLANHARKEEDATLQLLIFYQPFGVIHDLLGIYELKIVNLITLCEQM